MNMADENKEYQQMSSSGGGYESMVWIRDKDGKEYACYLKDIKNIKTKEELTEEEKAQCLDVSQIIGTERW
jgi:hypothetical protein